MARPLNLVVTLLNLPNGKIWQHFPFRALVELAQIGPFDLSDLVDAMGYEWDGYTHDALLLYRCCATSELYKLHA